MGGICTPVLPRRQARQTYKGNRKNAEDVKKAFAKEMGIKYDKYRKQYSKTYRTYKRKSR